MSKQRKKSNQLSSLQRAFCGAARFPVQNLSQFKQEFPIWKKNLEEKQKRLGYSSSSAVMPQQTISNHSDWQYMSKHKHLPDMVGTVRDFILNEWYSKKRVFRLSKETVEYVTERFPLDCLPGILDNWLSVISKTPIYLEFTDGLPVPAQISSDGNVAPPRTLRGVFFGQSYVQNDSVCNGKLTHTFLTVQVSEDAQFVFLHNESTKTVQEHASLPDGDAFQQQIISLLIYLSFVYQKDDAIGAVLIPKPRQGTHENYDVKPIPYLDSVPKKDDPTSVVVAGLCMSTKYLSRSNMVAYFRKRRADIPETVTYYSNPKSNVETESTQKYVNRKVCDMVLVWEQFRTIYQYTSATTAQLRAKYADNLSLGGLSKQLLKYFPQDTIVFHETDTGKILLLSLCDYTGSNDVKTTGITIAMLNPDDISIAVFPPDAIITYLPDNRVDDVVDAVSVLFHILTIFEQKAIKKQIQDIVKAGNPDSTDLVPLPPQPEVTHIPVNPKSPIPPLCYQVGQAIEDSPFELFAVTDRTVKRQRQEEKKIRMGWKVTPHVRRPHPHRYWVGKGAEKHLEVRWLERIQIHKEQGAEKTILHQIKAKQP